MWINGLMVYKEQWSDSVCVLQTRRSRQLLLEPLWTQTAAGGRRLLWRRRRQQGQRPEREPDGSSGVEPSAPLLPLLMTLSFSYVGSAVQKEDPVSDVHTRKHTLTLPHSELSYMYIPSPYQGSINSALF